MKVAIIGSRNVKNPKVILKKMLEELTMEEFSTFDNKIDIILLLYIIFLDLVAL